MRALTALGVLALWSWTAPPVFTQSYCQKSFAGSQGPGTGQLSVCGEKLAAGESATLLFTGGPPNQVAQLYEGSTSFPTAMGGGLLFPENPTMTPIQLDGTGSYSTSVQGGGGPSTMVAQVVYPDDGLPFGVGLSNAVQIYKLPDVRPVIKFVFALPYYSDGTYARTPTEAQAMADALRDNFAESCYDLFDVVVQISEQFEMPEETTFYETSGDPSYYVLRDVEQYLLTKPDLLAGMDFLVVHSESVWGGGDGGLGGFNGKYVLIEVDDSTTLPDFGVMHELGHTMGLSHSGAFRTPDPEQPVKNWHRAHPFDWMGSGHPTQAPVLNNPRQDPLHYHSWSKMRFGWIPPENVLEVDKNTEAGTDVWLLPNDNPLCAVPDGGTAAVVIRESAIRNWVIYNHFDDDPVPAVFPQAQALVVRAPYTEKSPTLLTGQSRFASGDRSLLLDQTPGGSTPQTQTLLDSGIPEQATRNIGGVSVQHVETLEDGVIHLRFTPSGVNKTYSETRVPNFVLDHSQRGQLFVSGVLEFTALDVLPPDQSQILDLEFELFEGGDGLSDWLQGIVPMGSTVPVKPTALATSGLIYPGVPPSPPSGDSAGYSPAPGDFHWLVDTATFPKGNQGYVVVASAESANGYARRKTPIMVKN